MNKSLDRGVRIWGGGQSQTIPQTTTERAPGEGDAAPWGQVGLKHSPLHRLGLQHHMGLGADTSFSATLF